MSFKDDAFDIALSYEGDERYFVLAEDPESKEMLYGQTFMDEVPTEQHLTGTGLSYNDAPSVVSQPMVMDQWSEGCGWFDAPPASFRHGGYSYARGIDPSWGRLILSPEYQSLSGITGTVTKVYDSPTFGQYALAGRYVYQFSGGSWVERYDSGDDAIVVTDIIEYGNAVDIYLFLAFDEAQIIAYSTNGTSFGSTVTDEKAAFFAVRGVDTAEPVMWKIRSNGYISASNAGISGWSTEDLIGLSGETVTALIEAGEYIWIFKEEGYWAYDGLNLDNNIEVRHLRETGNGSEARTFIDGTILVNYGNRVLAIDPFSFETTTIFEAAHPELNGTVAGIGNDTKHVYFALNTMGGDVYLMKGPVTGPFHTIAYIASDTAGEVFVASAGDIHSVNPCVVVPLSASTGYYILPRAGRRPWDDANCRYDTGGGTLWGAWLDKGATTWEAWLNASRVVCESATGARSVALGYDLDGTEGSTTTSVTAVEPGLSTARAGAEIRFTRLRHVVTLATGDSNHTPRGVAFVFDTTPNPPRYQFWSVTIAAESDKGRRGGGEASVEGFRSTLQFLKGAVGQRVTFGDYFGDSYVVKVLNVSSPGLRRKAGGQDRSRALGAITVTMAEIAYNVDPSNVFTWDESKWDAGDVWGSD